MDITLAMLASFATEEPPNLSTFIGIVIYNCWCRWLIVIGNPEVVLNPLRGEFPPEDDNGVGESKLAFYCSICMQK